MTRNYNKYRTKTIAINFCMRKKGNGRRLVFMASFVKRSKVAVMAFDMGK